MSVATIHRRIVSRDDLSFTDFESGARTCNWSVPHDRASPWSNGVEIGKYLFAEIHALAAHDEPEAFATIRYAINDPGWQPGGWGIEEGFSRALAAAAIVGLRALRAGVPPFDD